MIPAHVESLVIAIMPFPTAAQVGPHQRAPSSTLGLDLLGRPHAGQAGALEKSDGRFAFSARR